MHPRWLRDASPPDRAASAVPGWLPGYQLALFHNPWSAAAWQAREPGARSVSY